MRVEFAFGKSPLGVELPDGFGYRVLEARFAVPLNNPREAIESALNAPIGSPPLAELASGKRSAAISVCDITRPVPNRVILPSILRRLEDAGVARDKITILIATGSHRPATEAEIREICGDEIASSYAVENHIGSDLSAHRHLGTTRAGTRVFI